jgi:two-component system, OmpR family, sensor kinase
VALTLADVKVPFGLRAFFRAAFLLLALAVIALALTVLIGEKQRRYADYAVSLSKTHQQILARLRHPSGQLALLNPDVLQRDPTPLRPILLPYGALDFEDRLKARQAVENAGCQTQYPDGSSLCVAIGNNPYAGGFIYLVGSFALPELVPLPQMEFDVTKAHRALVSVNLKGEVYQWVAPFQYLLDGTSIDPIRAVVRGRLTGYNAAEPITSGTKSIRDFRAWLWQEGMADNELRKTSISIRLPIELWRDEIFAKKITVWPPADLAQMTVRLRLLAPGESVLFDSNQSGGSLPFSWNEIAQVLDPGETLRISRVGKDQAKPLVLLKGKDSQETPTVIPVWVDRLITSLPLLAVNTLTKPSEPGSLARKQTFQTAVGQYEVELSAQSQAIDRELAAVTSRVSWYLFAILGAIALTWLALELRIIRRVTTLTARAAQVTKKIAEQSEITALEIEDIKGRDELGSLSSSLQTLLSRVKEDVHRSQLRVQQERATWQAVGHEIMSPLQSLMVLHKAPNDPSARYIERMQQAIKVLYGSASPTEAFSAATPVLGLVEMDQFLAALCESAIELGLAPVRFHKASQKIMVRADEYWLEDVLGHLLANADRHRTPGTPIVISLSAVSTQVKLVVANTGPPIPDELLEKVFEYGVSQRSIEDERKADSGACAREDLRGQGLFVVRTYLSKMGASVKVSNTLEGVRFEINFLAAV